MPHFAVGIKAANTGSDDEGAGEGSKAASHVHNTTAGKVDDTRVQEEVFTLEGGDPAGAAPYPCTSTSPSLMLFSYKRHMNPDVMVLWR